MNNKLIATINEDGNYFFFLDVSDKARELFSSGLFELYEVYNNTESLLTNFQDLDYALSNGSFIGIEVGSSEDIVSAVKNREL